MVFPEPLSTLHPQLAELLEKNTGIDPRKRDSAKEFSRRLKEVLHAHKHKPHLHMTKLGPAPYHDTIIIYKRTHIQYICTLLHKNVGFSESIFKLNITSLASPAGYKNAPRTLYSSRVVAAICLHITRRSLVIACQAPPL